MKSTEDAASNTSALATIPDQTAAADISGCLDQGTFEFWITSSRGIAIKDEIPIMTLRDLTRNVAIMYEASGRQHAQASMMMGDILTFWEQKIEEDATQYIESTRAYMKVKQKTLENWQWVASKIDPSRRRENLSLEHHVAVAKHPAEVQEKYLRLAEDESMSVTELKAKMKEEFPSKPKGGKPAVLCKIDLTNEQAVADALAILAPHIAALETIPEEWAENLHTFEKAYRKHFRNNGKAQA